MSGAELAEVLAHWFARGVSGAVEWRDGRRRRLYFFQAGQLVAVQSNLKSESPQRLQELHPGLDAAALARKVAEVRLRGGLEEVEGVVETHVGVEAPSVEPVDLVGLLWAVADALPRPSERGFPRLRPGGASLLALLPIQDDLRAYLGVVDGTRPVEDVVDFGPGAPDDTRNAIALATLLGAMEVADAAAPSAIVTRPGATRLPPAEPAPAPRLTAGDIAAMIQEELEHRPSSGSHPSAPEPEVHGHEVVLKRKPAADPPDPRARLRAELARMHRASDHFATLGVRWNDAPEAMRRAYVALARELHPDRWRDASPEEQEEVTAAFDKVRAAWEVLGDEVAREKYVARVIRGEKSEEEQAMERVKRILEAEAEFKRGVTELNAGRVLHAHDYFQRACNAIPEDLEMRAYLGYTTFRLALGRDARKAEEGFRMVEEATKARERFDQGHVLLGMMYRALGEEGKARQCFIQALRIRPANVDAQRELKRDPAKNPFEAASGAREEPRADSIWTRLFKSK